MFVVVTLESSLRDFLTEAMTKNLLLFKSQRDLLGPFFISKIGREVFMLCHMLSSLSFQALLVEKDRHLYLCSTYPL